MAKILYGTFNPEAAYASIRVFLATTAVKEWQIKQADAITAFLTAPLRKKFTSHPDGYVNGNKVWHLEKILYGLKHAGDQ